MELASPDSGSNTVWNGWDGNDFEIFFYNGTTTTQLTNNDFSDYYPQISGSNVVWYGENGDAEIFFTVVPEPSSVLGILTFGLFGIGSLLGRRQLEN